MTQSRPSGSGGWPWANSSSGWSRSLAFLGIESQSPKRPGNRLWELLRARKLDVPHVRVGRLYRFNLVAVEAWTKRQTIQNGRRFR